MTSLAVVEQAAPPKTFARALRDTILVLRVRHWLKNLLIFVPAAVGHQVVRPDVFIRLLLAFASFSFCTSAGYLVNDLLDLESDRRHPGKRQRPLAAGTLSPRFAIVAAVLLFLTALGIGNALSKHYVLFLCGYVLLAVAYSKSLKTEMLMNVFLLTLFYTWRVLAGGEAANVHVSFWLAAFSTFFFFSLAVLKRFVELRLLLDTERDAAQRRNYRPADLSMLAVWGAASGCASVVVLALYINSQDVLQLYHRPQFLWLVCLAVLFWLNRVWMLANRDELPYDPIEFAVCDRASYIIAGFVLLSVLLAL